MIGQWSGSNGNRCFSLSPFFPPQHWSLFRRPIESGGCNRPKWRRDSRRRCLSLSFCPYKQHVLDTLCSRERGARQVEACNSFLPFRPSLAGRRERNYRTYFTVGIFQTSGNWRRSRSKGGKTPEDVADIAQGMCTVCSVYTHRRRNLNNEREEEE